MARVFLFLFLFNALPIFSQSPESIDSLVAEICKSIDENQSEVDSVRLYSAFSKHMPGFLFFVSEEKTDDVLNEIYLRLQTTCSSFWKIMKHYSSPDNNWIEINGFANSTCSKKDCDALFHKSGLYYVEPTGDTTKVSLKDNQWIDYLSDGSFSKLSLKRLNNTDFEIVFKESNHPIKQKLSRPGDKYIYRILEKRDNYYLMQMKVGKTEIYAEFKIYFHH